MAVEVAGKLAKGALLLWLHPTVARIDCKDCALKLYDLKTGKPKSYRSGPERAERFYEGPKHAPACKHGVTCPKGTIETASETELSWRNLKCLNAWRRFRVAPQQVDRLAADNFALLSELWEIVLQQKLSRRIVDSVSQFMV